MSASTYRPDVDGLRAVAVALVVLYHGHVAFSGGFVGVDVFFVISGYLITSLIRREQQEGSFALSGFWLRRIRRIVPAAAVMAFVTLAAGAVLLYPRDYTELAEATAAHQVLLANIFFWQRSGYFQGPAELKPLLHTWSLAVEEQFYLLYPFVLVGLGRLRPKVAGTVLAVAAMASLLLSEFGVLAFPSATFYLLPMRAWELLLGGLLCYVPTTWSNSGAFRQLLSVIGLAMIFVAAWRLDAQSAFPGFAALVPCLGTAAVIYANTQQRTLVGRLLALRPVVFVGLISYSLYLWHWPLFAFSRYWLGERLAGPTIGLICGASLVAAYLSWRFVETPFRQGLRFRYPGSVLMILAATVPLLVGLSIGVILGNGFPARIPAEVLRFKAAAQSMAFTYEVDTYHVLSDDVPRFGAAAGTKACLVWGDSHAMALVPGLDAAARKLGIRGYQATHSVTAPLLDFVANRRHGLADESPRFARAVVELVRRRQIDSVVLAGKWSLYAADPTFGEQLERTVDELRSAGAKVAIVLDVADQEVDVPNALARRAFFRAATSDVGVPLAVHRLKNEKCDAVIRRVARDKARVLDPAETFVDARGVWRVESEGQVLYRDSSHLTVAGALRLEPMFADLLAAIAADSGA